MLVTRYIESERVKAAERSAREADQSEWVDQEDDGYDPDPDPAWEDVLKLREEADKAVARAEARVGIRRWPRHLRRLRIVLEVAIPMLCGALALWLSASQLSDFAIAVWGGVKS